MYASDSKREGKGLWTKQQQAFPELNLFSLYSCMQFWFVNALAKYLNLPH